MVSLAEPPAVIVVGSTVAVAPDGSPDTLIDTDCGSPDTTVVSTDPVSVPPRATRPMAGVVAIEKSLGGAGLGDGLNVGPGGLTDGLVGGLACAVVDGLAGGLADGEAVMDGVGVGGGVGSVGSGSMKSR